MIPGLPDLHGPVCCEGLSDVPVVQPFRFGVRRTTSRLTGWVMWVMWVTSPQQAFSTLQVCRFGDPKLAPLRWSSASKAVHASRPGCERLFLNV